MANAKEQLIVDVWTQTGKESVGAEELELIQRALLERFGAEGRESPAAIARTLADHGARLEHPQILEADLRWRERNVFSLFTSEELNLTSIDAAIEWIEKLGALEPQPELRRLVLRLKTELELVAARTRIPENEREIAGEVAQWLAIWLQNQTIFAEWLDLRRASPEFRQKFVPQKST